MRAARIAGLVSLTLVSVFISAGPAAATSVGVSTFKVAPAYARGGGSTVTFTARTKNATSCRLKSSVPIKGLPKAVSCADGSERKNVAIPASKSNKARKIVFTFTAKHGSLTATAHVTVHQDPALAKITSLTRSPRSADANKATRVRVKASVRHSKTCKLSSASTIGGLPATASCTSGSFAKTVSVPGNPTGKARTITLTLSARNSIGKRVTRTTTITQPGAAAPTVALQPTPATLTSGGGSLTVKGTITHAKTCQLTSSPSIGSVSGSCTSGTISKAFSIPANTSSATRSYVFTLKATGPGGVVTRRLTMTQPAGPVQILTIGSTPASLTADSTSITVNVTLKGASTCSMTSSPDKGSAPPSGACAAGTFSHTFPIGANTGSSARNYTFSISASGPGGSAIGSLSIGQPGKPVPAPEVQTIASSPANLQSTQTPITVTATVSNATTCTLASSDGLGTTGAVSCTGGSISKAFTVLANTTASPKTYTFTLAVDGPGGTANGMLTMTQPPTAVAARPSIDSITPTPSSLTATGGSLTVTAAVSNATSCTLTGDHGLGTTTNSSCTLTPHVSKVFTIPTNTTANPVTYTFTVAASGAGGTASGTLTMTQPGTTPAAPQVTIMTSSPASVTSSGGHFTIAATIAHGVTCSLTSNATIVSTTSSNCSAGNFGGVISIPANTTSTNQTYTVTVHVSGVGGAMATGTLTYTVPPPPPTASLTSTPKTLSSGGGNLTVTGTVTRATSCALASTPNLGSKSGDCSSTFGQTFSVPSNHSGSTKTYTFTLSVTGAGGSASATLSLTQPST
jgi:hypothetical protein